jgi:hypothetical protein
VFPIKHSKPDNWNTRKHYVIKLIENVIVNGGTTEETNPAKHPNWDYVKHVFVKHVGD